MATETIGFLGLGLMGHGMARNIVEKGFPGRDGAPQSGAHR